MKLIVNGVATHYEKTGSGPTILLLHGWADSLNTFKNLTEKLSASYEIVVVDLPGFGASETPQTAYDLDAYAQFVSDFVKKLNIDVFAVLGHSNGGAIAIKAISKNLIQPQKLVLLASAGIRSRQNGKKIALRIGAKAVKIPLQLLPKNAQNKIKKQAYGAIGSDLYAAEHMQGTFKRVVSEDVLRLTDKIRIPVLLLYGNEDKDTPVLYGTIFKERFPHAELEIIPGSGHFLHQTHSEAVSASILKFFKR